MSYEKRVDLVCDSVAQFESPRCVVSTREYDFDSYDAATVESARRQARGFGWNHRNGLDLCPYCDEFMRAKGLKP